MHSRQIRKNGDLFFEARAAKSDQRDILPSISTDEYDDNSKGIDTRLNSLCLIDADAEPTEIANAQLVDRAQSFPLHETKFPLLARLNLPTKHMRIKKAWSEQEISFPKLKSEPTKEEVKPARRSRDASIDNRSPRLFSRQLPSIDDGQTRPINTKAFP